MEVNTKCHTDQLKGKLYMKCYCNNGQYQKYSTHGYWLSHVLKHQKQLLPFSFGGKIMHIISKLKSGKDQVTPFYVTVIKHYLASLNVNLSTFINLPVASINFIP